MKLWLLKRRSDFPRYDVLDACVVRSPDAGEARKLAASVAGDEGKDTWMLEELTSCDELTVAGEAGLILQDFNAG